MISAGIAQPLSPGQPAPPFTLPAVDGSQPISLSDYYGRSPLFLALLIGLWCPFCRRQIAQIGTIEGKLKVGGIEALGIVATPPENARLYFKFRPTRLRLAADPELATHRAYGLPKPTPTPELIQDRKSTRLNSSHVRISYAVFCLKKKKKKTLSQPTARRRSETRCQDEARTGL